MWSADGHHPQPTWFEPVEKPLLGSWLHPGLRTTSTSSGQCSHSRASSLNSWHHTGCRMCALAGTHVLMQGHSGMAW